MALGPMVVGAGMPALTKDDITKALGYTPPQQDTTYSTATETTAGLMSAEMVTTLQSLAASSSGSWKVEAYDISYIRFTNGIQICWVGVDECVSSSKTSTFPVPFVDTQYKVLNTYGSYSNAPSRTKTSLIFPSLGSASSFVCIGRWK